MLLFVASSFFLSLYKHFVFNSYTCSTIKMLLLFLEIISSNIDKKTKYHNFFVQKKTP